MHSKNSLRSTGATVRTVNFFFRVFTKVDHLMFRLVFFNKINVYFFFFFIYLVLPEVIKIGFVVVLQPQEAALRGTHRDRQRETQTRPPYR